jgi:predicted dehydrogenase
MTPRTGITRRALLKSAVAAAAAPYVVPAGALGLGQAVAPSDRITLGVIGTGSRSEHVMGAFLHREGCQVLAVCDVQAAARDRARQVVRSRYASAAASGLYKGCRAYGDFRDLLARADIDAVAVTTPDHWHVPIGLAAARAGKDIYGEKPLGITVREGREMVAAARRYGTVFQHGTQRRSFARVRFGCELVRNGRIGKLHTVEVSCDASWAGKVVRPEPVPPGFDYDMWLGQAPWAPYSRARVYRFGWFFISDYCPTGWVAGQGVHYVDLAHWGMDTERTGPVEIDGRGVYPADGLFDTATSFHIECTYANGVKLVFTSKDENPIEGVRFHGTDGWVHVQNDVDAHPRSLLKTVWGPDDLRLNHSRSNVDDFLECIRTRAQTVAPVDVAHRASTVCSLCDISMRLGRKLRWDPDRQRFLNDPRANEMLSRAMREPWTR